MNYTTKMSQNLKTNEAKLEITTKFASRAEADMAFESVLIYFRELAAQGKAKEIKGRKKARRTAAI